ncbi:MAG: asparaginase domain-containing protein [Pseudomonadota bacterium]
MPQEIAQRPLRLIYAGGTIGSAGSPLAPLDALEFRRRWELSVAPRLAARPKTAMPVTWFWIDPPLDSSDMAPADWLLLTREALKSAAEARGIVLLHGTDTLASSAAALTFLLTALDEEGRPAARLASPVIVTGSQRPLFDGDGIAAGTDAFENLAQAIAMAGSSDAAPGVSVVFAGKHLPGARVAKQHTAADAAFDCPNGAAWPPPLPAAEASDLVAQLDALASTFGSRPVPVFHPMPEGPVFQARMLDALADTDSAAPPAGLLLAGFGEGNLPPRAAAAISGTIRRLRGRGAPVLVASQVPGGPAGRAAYAAGHWLAEAGAIPAGHMTLSAAHAKLHLGAALARTRGWTLDRLETWLRADLAGETLPPSDGTMQ